MDSLRPAVQFSAGRIHGPFPGLYLIAPVLEQNPLVLYDPSLYEAGHGHKLSLILPTGDAYPGGVHRDRATLRVGANIAGLDVLPVIVDNPLLLLGKPKIGRASCRERVCQYV